MAVQFTINFNFLDAAQRSAALLDYAKAHSLDIYVKDGNGLPTSVVDATLVAPAVTAHIKQKLKVDVVEYRARLASESAAISSRNSENTALDV